MKHATLLFISIWFSMGAYAQQTIIHFPLHPIESDSVYFMDFFWHDIQEEAVKTPLTTQRQHIPLKWKISGPRQSDILTFSAKATAAALGSHSTYSTRVMPSANSQEKQDTLTWPNIFC